MFTCLVQDIIPDKILMKRIEEDTVKRVHEAFKDAPVEIFFPILAVDEPTMMKDILSGLSSERATCFWVIRSLDPHSNEPTGPCKLLRAKKFKALSKTHFKQCANLQ